MIAVKRLKLPSAMDMMRKLGGAAAIIALIALMAGHSLLAPVRFHQFNIQWLRVMSGPDRLLAARQLALSRLSAGPSAWRALDNSRPSSLDDVNGVLEFVFSWIPPIAYVHPTEAFYYFTASVAGVPVRGSIRLADLQQGELTLSYFTPSDKATFSITISARDGLRVVKPRAGVYTVAYRGHKVNFRMPDTKQEKATSARVQIEEEYVATVVDESGVTFGLLFNRTDESFYYVLDPDRNSDCKLKELGCRLHSCVRTGFIYYQDSQCDRMLLVGVALDNIKANNMFDGPADQVPFDADIGDELLLAYPSTRLGEGTDRHGVFLEEGPWRRLAISPYMRYVSEEEIVERVGAIHERFAERGKGCLSTQLTREWWNTPAWRADIMQSLSQEGKDYTAMATNARARLREKAVGQ